MITRHKPIIYAALRMTGSDITRNLQTFRKLDLSRPETVEQYQIEALKRLCRPTYRTVPYYTDTLDDADVVRKVPICHLRGRSVISW